MEREKIIKFQNKIKSKEADLAKYQSYIDKPLNTFIVYEWMLVIIAIIFGVLLIIGIVNKNTPLFVASLITFILSVIGFVPICVFAILHRNKNNKAPAQVEEVKEELEKLRFECRALIEQYNNEQLLALDSMLSKNLITKEEFDKKKELLLFK